MRLGSKTASILSKHFSPISQRGYHDILSTTLSVCLKNGALQLLTQLRCVKTILLAPYPRSGPGPFQIFCWSGFPWQYFYFIFSTYGGVNLVFYILIVFQQTAWFIYLFLFSCIFILLSRESDQCAIRARLGVAGHLSTTPRWGNPAKCLSQRHNK